ncbi:hypothetical protein [Spirosoma pollinicola]|uniref:Lipocalin-like domain-containing protein n=1 Tax=Spirosoma pollinicola TaxID=2057025 RepID=A0A2K8YVH0_9BACT|nr:hypothetical protein [Spirosoma pollinicola]AUD01621.1 hypothetical protein CWM47_07190 [Spirosoma pollinicola]
MRFSICILLLSLGFVACEKTTAVSPDTLTGIWVEQTGRQDTLIFNLDRSGRPLPNSLLVNRGREVNSAGSLVPKLGSGYYGYELKDKSILVISLFSSSTQRSAYKIERKGNQLLVENFFELGFNQSATATRTLVRL